MTALVALATLLGSSVASADDSATADPQVVTATAASRKEADAPQSTSVYAEHGLLGPVRLGPTVGVGAPDGARVGFELKLWGYLSLGAAGSMLPETQIPTTDAKVKRVSGEAFLRLHPFRGAFFLGVSGGVAQTKGSITGETTAFNRTTSADGHAYARAMYVAPQIGFQWMLPFGMTVGMDIGAQIPVMSKDPTYDVSKYGLTQSVEAKGMLADAMGYVATGVVPVVHFLELGYLL